MRFRLNVIRTSFHIETCELSRIGQEFRIYYVLVNGFEKASYFTGIHLFEIIVKKNFCRMIYFILNLYFILRILWLPMNYYI